MSGDMLNGVQEELNSEYAEATLDVQDKIRLTVVSDGSREGTYVQDQDGRIVEDLIDFEYLGGGTGNPVVVLRLAAPSVEIKHVFKPLPVCGGVQTLGDMVRQTQERALQIAKGEIPKQNIVLDGCDEEPCCKNDPTKDCVVEMPTMAVTFGKNEGDLS